MNTTNPKQIIIFGATGDVGKYLTYYLLKHINKKDFEIIAIGSKESHVFDELEVNYISVDITNANAFKKLENVTNPYAVIHLAGMMPARMKGYDPQRYIDVNITGTLNILNYCINKGIDRILYSQSFGDIKEYSEKKPVLHADMQRSFSFNNDHSVYVMTKNMAVDLIEHYHQKYGIKNFTFRLPTIYLWSEVDTYYVDGEIRKIGYRDLIDKAMSGGTIEIWGDKTRKKDMVYVKDFCQMLYLALISTNNNGYYNVGTGIGTSLEDQIKGIIDVFSPNNMKSIVKERPDLPNAPQYIMDITPAVNELGYKPKYNYIDMLTDMKYHMENKTYFG
ncbi:NAD-dependent epimerase/dehydratase family protein [Butyrivibrio sp. XBB1001]|uniref:NAD-dependent epimerase/dehydratase family protein n=1 Tax=Butyrivibrio sp. XBB1001 TaxID=1280682 RepID=UPI000413BB43|nr:NAD(P)-dependent oxidoreductase [Butyrivibrio sp. XBB1001]